MVLGCPKDSVSETPIDADADADADTDADTDADADADADADIYDDCADECMGDAQFFGLTGLYPGGDISFRYRTFRCSMPTTSPTADVNVFIDGNFSTYMAGSVTDPDVFVAVSTASAAWDDQSQAQLTMTVHPVGDPVFAGPSSAGHVWVRTIDPSLEPLYSDMGYLAGEIELPGASVTYRSAEVRFWPLFEYSFDNDGDGFDDTTIQDGVGYSVTGSGTIQILGPDNNQDGDPDLHTFPRFALTRVAQHEIGHALGLGHVITGTNVNHVMRQGTARGSIWSISGPSQSALGYMYPTTAPGQQRLDGTPCPLTAILEGTSFP